MANSSNFLVVLIFLLSSFVITTTAEDFLFVEKMDRETMNLQNEKLSHFRFYWQDIISGKNPSGVNIIQPANSSKTGFGFVRMIDNPLTIAPELGSKMVGRAQGFYALASQEELALLMTMNFVFIEGKYNGSTITILGRNQAFNSVREMSVVGGSGLFRWARGYAQARTHTFDTKTGDATVQYDVYVLHF